MVQAGLEVVEHHDPSALGSLKAHADGIFVQGRERYRLAHWNQTARLCVFTVSYLTNAATTAHEVALTLVHEGMHARLGVSGATAKRGRRRNAELLSAMAELALARRIPHAPQLVERSEKRIDKWSTAGEDELSDAALRGAALEHIRELGAPDWLVSLLGRVSRWLARAA